MWMLPPLLLPMPALGATVDPSPVVVVERQSRRQGAGHLLRVEAPQGLKLDGASPVDVELTVEGREMQASLPAEAFGRGLPVGELGSEAVEGRLTVVLCEPVTNVCTRSNWALSGTPPRRGSADLAVEKTASSGPFGPKADLDAVDAAFAKAAQTGKPVLLDFSAVWCPPCVELRTEVLEADPRPVGLDEVHVAVVDVDHASSFALKDRYDIGGYPTSIVVRPDGTELTRLVGYPGADAYLDWVATAPKSTDAADREGSPDDVTPERAAQIALTLANERLFDDAKAWLASAVERGADTADVRVTRVLLEPTGDDLAWLQVQAPERLSEVSFVLPQLAEESPKLVKAVLKAQGAEATGLELVTLLHVRADVAKTTGKTEEHQETAAYAAHLLAAIIDQDPHVGKAYVTWLASLWRTAERLDRMVAVLEQASADYPTEPTFDLSLTRHLVQEERFAEALVAAERAATRAWGDNALRVTQWRADALVGLGRSEDAKTLLENVLASSAVAQSTDVRTHIYRKRLQKKLDALGEAR